MTPTDDDYRICPKTGKRILTRPVPSTWLFVVTGIGALLWMLFRIVPKPSRAAYPCQRVAAATALGMLSWLVGAGSIGVVYRTISRRLVRATTVTVFASCAVVLFGVAWILAGQPASVAAAYTTWTPVEGSNSPMGQARGIFPGRVVWAYDPLATRWDGNNGHWWDPEATDQNRVDALLSKSLQSLTGASSDAEAWSALFSSFNQRRGRSGGYGQGQKIVVKINQNTARGGHAQDGLATGDQNPINGNPHVILALLRQLVNQGGVAQDDITVYDITRFIGDSIFVPCHAEFSGVHFVELDSGGGDGREAFDGQWVQNALTFAGQGVGRNLPKFVVDASYMINLASLKAHGDDAGPTLHAKNHYGTVSGLNHTWPNTPNSYSFFVEMMGSKSLGENTFLFMIDGLYGAPGADASPAKFVSYPFSGNWPSSLILSQDGVANESVGWDFINAEWGVPAGCDNTLHEAATANAPGSGTTYAPNGDGLKLPSLGVHEHWNNPVDKKYSRNLGTGNGIELVPLIAPDAPMALARTGWTATASKEGDKPANAIDGKLNTRWQAVLEHLTRRGPVTRRTLFRDFQKDDPGALGSVLSDLVSSGFVSRTGSGESSVYGVTHEEERSLMAREGNLETVCSLFWLEIAKHPGISADELAPYLSLSTEVRDQALTSLVADGRVSLTNGRYYTDGMAIPVGATEGWEVAVLDHYRSVCGGIARKLRANVTRSGVADIVGGATLTFDVEPGHPQYAEVRSLLRTIRVQVNELWDRVEAHNDTHAIPESILERVTFYFGQFTDAEETDS
jgi:hypothetical protein